VCVCAGVDPRCNWRFPQTSCSCFFAWSAYTKRGQTHVANHL